MKYVSPAEVAEVSRGWFASLDPGLVHPAIAGFYDGVLKFASRVPVPGKIKDLYDQGVYDIGERSRQVVKLIVAFWYAKTNGVKPCAIATEWPWHYPREMSKRPNDLTALAAIDLGVACALDVRIIASLPREWAGQIPKAKTGKAFASPRGRILHGRLSILERLAVVESHDAVDGLGIGLHRLGRFGKVFPT